MINQITYRLCKAGHQVYLVGGAVRDELIGRPANDEDLVTSARPEEILNLFTDLKTLEVGKSFGVVLIEGIEIATFRADLYGGLSHKDCVISYADTIEADLARRDLTINAMAVCEVTGNLIDPFNGKYDLHNRIIRFVGQAKDRIHEDPERLLRALRFKNDIQGKFAPETMRALINYGHLIQHVAKERIRQEIMKALKTKKASGFFMDLNKTGMLKYVLPCLNDCVGHTGGDHHQETVFEHCMLAGDHISPKYPLVKLAAYLHDVGKPLTYKDGHFLEHEDVGALVVWEALGDLRFAKFEIDAIAGLIRTHMNFVVGLTPGPRGDYWPV